MPRTQVDIRPPTRGPLASPGRRRWLSAAVGAPLVLSASLAGCSRTPLRLAILAGLTGPVSDLGTAARDGAALAFEEASAERRIEWLEFDDAQQPDALPALAERIAQAQVTAVIGPATSSMAQAWIPQAQRLGLLTMSPTVTSHDFAGQDDLFFRVCATTRGYARRTAEFAIRNRGWKRFALIRDDSNAPYTRSWARFFHEAAVTLGAEVAEPAVFHRRQGPVKDPIAALDQAMRGQPDVVVIVANATDTALLSQAVAARSSAPALLAAEWAATDQLILGGGRAVEGLLVTQFFDRNSPAPRYLAYADRFQQRYGRATGFAEAAAYDAARVVLQALAQQRGDETLKATLLRVRQFEGLQNPVVFDDFGDCDRPLIVTEVRDGRFVGIA